METCRRVHYTGSVQGVGFRFTARGLAQRYAITGYVRNLSDGSVEVLACGEPEEIKVYLEALRSAMRDYIADEKSQVVQLDEHYDTFDVRF